MQKSEICKKFLANPGINPETGKPIQKGKPTYNRLLKMCEEVKTSPKSVRHDQHVLPTKSPKELSHSQQSTGAHSEIAPPKVWAVVSTTPLSQRRVKKDQCTVHPDCRVDDIYCKRLKIIGDKCKGPWIMKDMLGKGVNGEIFNLCDKVANCQYVIKVVYNDVLNEVDLQVRASEAGMAPKIFQYFVGKSGRQYIVMEKIRGETVADLLKNIIKKEVVSGKPNFERLSKTINSLVKDMFDAIKRLHSAGIEHKDLHLNNVMYNEDKDELQFIDFGFSKLIENFNPLFLDDDYVRVINEFQSYIPFYFRGTVYFDDVSHIHDKKNPLRLVFEDLDERRENAFKGKF